MIGKILVERNVMVSMRDGVQLAADVYRPSDDSVHPVLVYRLPYNKSSASSVGGLMINPLTAVDRGYVVVIQDTRGRFQSQGTWTPLVNEAADGYDTIEWAARQPWSNGQVGIYGSSYMGAAALQAAVAAPPHLKAAVAYLAGANYFDGWTYSGGALELGFNLSWSLNHSWDTLARLKLDPAKRQALTQELTAAVTDLWPMMRHLPLADMPVLRDGLAPFWREWLQHSTYDEHWKAIDVARRADEIKVPVLHITGWYDIFLRGHLDLNLRLQTHASDLVRQNHRMIIGPWDHSAYQGQDKSAAGDREFGPQAISGPALTTDLVLQWFDRWLIGRETPLMSKPRVRYYLMGDNVWKDTEAWPPLHTPARYYLHSGGQANTRFGNGTLSSDLPGGQPADSYIYDPETPVPTLGGRAYRSVSGPGGVQDQTRVEERGDVLVYTSSRLLKPLTIAGPVTVTLWVASSAPDTDFTGKLVDMEPGGYCAVVADGIIRARYRNSMEKPEWLIPGEITTLTVDLWDVAYTFRPGHSLRLEISSSNFPRFSRNANSTVSPEEARASDFSVAVQQVFHDAEHPSRMTLPVVTT